MTTNSRTRPVIMPDNTRLMDWNIQSTVNTILDTQPDDEVDQSVLDLLRDASHQDRLRIGLLIDEKATGPRHIIEAVIEQIVQESHEHLKSVAQDQTMLPEVDSMALQAINDRRLYRNLLSLTINDLLDQMPGPQAQRLQQHLLQIPLEQQETIDQTVQQIVARHEKSIQALSENMLQSVRDVLYPEESK